MEGGGARMNVPLLTKEGIGVVGFLALADGDVALTGVWPEFVT